METDHGLFRLGNSVVWYLCVVFAEEKIFLQKQKVPICWWSRCEHKRRWGKLPCTLSKLLMFSGVVAWDSDIVTVLKLYDQTCALFSMSLLPSGCRLCWVNTCYCYLPKVSYIIILLYVVSITYLWGLWSSCILSVNILDISVFAFLEQIYIQLWISAANRDCVWSKLHYFS